MRKLSLLLLITLFYMAQQASAQSVDEMKIRQILDRQTRAWNAGDLDLFMAGYWKNDSLMFIGKSGVTYGWQETLDNYKRGYPDRTAMGELSFQLLELRPLSPDCFFVVGKWHLKRSIGDLEGHYTLLWKKIKGEWLIVADHSS